MKRVILKIYGEVQGVSFRWQTKDIVDALGLVGWVRNETDGTVKVVVEGEEEGLKKFLEKCYTVSSARVEKIEAEWQEATGEFGKVSIKY